MTWAHTFQSLRSNEMLGLTCLELQGGSSKLAKALLMGDRTPGKLTITMQQFQQRGTENPHE